MSVTHGTESGYIYWDCRCEACRDARNQRVRERRAYVTPPPVPEGKHGTITAYSHYRCRCRACRGVWAAYLRAYRARRKGATA